MCRRLHGRRAGAGRCRQRGHQRQEEFLRWGKQALGHPTTLIILLLLLRSVCWFLLVFERFLFFYFSSSPRLFFPAFFHLQRPFLFLTRGGESGGGGCFSMRFFFTAMMHRRRRHDLRSPKVSRCIPEQYYGKSFVVQSGCAFGRSMLDIILFQPTPVRRWSLSRRAI